MVTTDPQFGTGLVGLSRSPAPRRIAYVQFVVFVAIGVILLLGGMRRYNAAQPIAGGQTTSGTVVHVTTGQHCGRHGCSDYWVPTIQFTANGGDYDFAGPQASTPMNLGDAVQVSYDPRNPAGARDLSAGVGAAWSLLVFGVLAILICRRCRRDCVHHSCVRPLVTPARKPVRLLHNRAVPWLPMCLERSGSLDRDPPPSTPGRTHGTVARPQWSAAPASSGSSRAGAGLDSRSLVGLAGEASRARLTYALLWGGPSGCVLAQPSH
jgi:hypothetical protein